MRFSFSGSIETRSSDDNRTSLKEGYKNYTIALHAKTMPDSGVREFSAGGGLQIDKKISQILIESAIFLLVRG